METDFEDVILSFVVAGPNWKRIVTVNGEIVDGEADRYMEAATKALLIMRKSKAKDMQLGALLSVKLATEKEPKFVNTYFALVNAAMHTEAETLKKAYISQTGQDLSNDPSGGVSS